MERPSARVLADSVQQWDWMPVLRHLLPSWWRDSASPLL